MGYVGEKKTKQNTKKKKEKLDLGNGKRILATLELQKGPPVVCCAWCHAHPSLSRVSSISRGAKETASHYFSTWKKFRPDLLA